MRLGHYLSIFEEYINLVNDSTFGGYSEKSNYLLALRLNDLYYGKLVLLRSIVENYICKHGINF